MEPHAFALSYQIIVPPSPFCNGVYDFDGCAALFRQICGPHIIIDLLPIAAVLYGLADIFG